MTVKNIYLLHHEIAIREKSLVYDFKMYPAGI